MIDEYGSMIIPSGRRRVSFSPTERREILIAMSVLSLAFFLILYRGLPLGFAVAIALVATITGFLAHELGHKFVAQKYGAWAEFRTFKLGLVLALLMAFTGFLFAAPGAVYIQGRISKRQSAMISIAGPGVNMVMAVGFLVLSLIAGAIGQSGIGFVLQTIAYLNAILAVFNLIPFPPLDGSKILPWRWDIWLGMIVVGGVLLLLSGGHISF